MKWGAPSRHAVTTERGVQRDDVVDQLLAQVLERAAPDHVASVVDQHVEAAERPEVLLDDPGDVGGIGDVALEQRGLAAGRAHVRRDLVGGPGAIVVVHADPRAAPAEAPGHGRADPAARTRDQHRP
jgi:hypothetical protein